MDLSPVHQSTDAALRSRVVSGRTELLPLFFCSLAIALNVFKSLKKSKKLSVRTACALAQFLDFRFPFSMSFVLERVPYRKQFLKLRFNTLMA